MATLNATLTLSSADLTSSESLNLTLTDALDVMGPVETKRMAIASGAANLAQTPLAILAATSYKKSYVLLYNTSTTVGEVITIGTAASSGAALEPTATQISLAGGAAGGEWCFFPWESDVDLMADAITGTPILEVRIFQNPV